MKPVYENFCRCCGQSYPSLPSNSWLTNISGWHRVRIKTKHVDNKEIGCGNNPADAVKEAWEWIKYEK